MDSPKLSASALEKLQVIAGRENVLTSDEDRLCYAYDGQRVERVPDAIVRPSNADEVARILVLANEERVAIVPRGGGTGLSGGSVARTGGIVLDLTRMNTKSLRSIRGIGTWSSSRA